MARPSLRCPCSSSGSTMGPAQLVQLQPVLEGAQEAVRLVQPGAVLAPDVPPAGQPGQRAEGGDPAERLVVAAVHHLQQLDGELHVPQPARAELDLPAGLGRGDVLQDPAAHGLHVGDEVLPLARGPHHRRDLRDVPLPHLEVTGDGTGLQQRLELPRARPALVVGHVAGQGPHQRPRLALRAQGRVDRPDRPLRGVVGADLDQVGGEQGASADRGVLVVAVVRLDDEDHVDVADVVELAAAALAHRDHREARGTARVTGTGASDRQRRLQGAARRGRPARLRRRPPRARGRDRGPPAAAAASVLDAQRVDRLGVGQPRDRLLVGRVRPDRGEQRGAQGEQAAGGSSPRVGSASSTQCSGCRCRCRARASLAPSTWNSRIAVPSSSARSASEGARVVEGDGEVAQVRKRGVGVRRAGQQRKELVAPGAETS